MPPPTRNPFPNPPPRLSVMARCWNNLDDEFVTKAGLFSAYIFKTLYFGRHSTDREVALMILMACFSYMLAELFDHYTWHNVTESSRITTKHAFATLSFVAEIFIFLYVGMDALDIEKWQVISDSPGTSVTVSSVLLALILLGRAAFVFPLSFLSNLTKKSPNDKINLKQRVIDSYHKLLYSEV